MKISKSNIISKPTKSPKKTEKTTYCNIQTVIRPQDISNNDKATQMIWKERTKNEVRVLRRRVTLFGAANWDHNELEENYSTTHHESTTSTTFGVRNKERKPMLSIHGYFK